MQASLYSAATVSPEERQSPPEGCFTVKYHVEQAPGDRGGNSLQA